MPFKSDAQRRFMYAFHPKIATRFSAETPKDINLPAKIGDQSAEETKRRRIDVMKKMARQV